MFWKLSGGGLLARAHVVGTPGGGFGPAGEAGEAPSASRRSTRARASTAIRRIRGAFAG
jgi:hypothetical protein